MSIEKERLSNELVFHTGHGKNLQINLEILTCTRMHVQVSFPSA